MENYRVSNFGVPEVEVERLRKQAAVKAHAERAAMIMTGMPLRGRGLDVGCGPGHFGAFLSVLGRDLVIDGVDADRFSADAAAKVLNKTWAADCGGAVAIQPPEGGPYDFAYSRLVLRHISTPLEALRRQAEVVWPRSGWVGALEASDDSLVMDPWPAWFGEVMEARALWFARKGWSADAGHLLPGLFARSGLQDICVEQVAYDTASLGREAFGQIVLVPLFQAAADILGDPLCDISGSTLQLAEESVKNWLALPDSYGSMTMWVVGGRRA